MIFEDKFRFYPTLLLCFWFEGSIARRGCSVQCCEGVQLTKMSLVSLIEDSAIVQRILPRCVGAPGREYSKTFKCGKANCSIVFI